MALCQNKSAGNRNGYHVFYLHFTLASFEPLE
jgi:hypothetical protein